MNGAVRVLDLSFGADLLHAQVAAITRILDIRDLPITRVQGRVEKMLTTVGTDVHPLVGGVARKRLGRHQLTQSQGPAETRVAFRRRHRQALALTGIERAVQLPVPRLAVVNQGQLVVETTAHGVLLAQR